MAKAKRDGKNGIDRWSSGGVSIRNITPPKKAKRGTSNGRTRK